MNNITYQFERCGPRSPIRISFMEAWNDMYLWVKNEMASNNMSLQVLETAIWIEVKNNCDGGKYPIYFYDARDRAIDEGWIQPE